MRPLVVVATAWCIPLVSLCSQSKPDSARTAPAIDSTRRAATPAVLTRVEVRATRRRTPSLQNGLPDATTRRETPAFELLNPFGQGQFGALLNVSPEFVITGSGQFSLLGGPAGSNQLTLGGVRVPNGLVIGEVRSEVAASPWDVSVGGAAGATVSVGLSPGSRFGSTYAIARTGAQGVTGGGLAASTGISSPLQGTLSSSGARGRLGYSANLFGARTTVGLPRWAARAPVQTQSILDSLAQVSGTPLLQAEETSQQYGLITRLDLLPRETDAAPSRQPTEAHSLTVALTGTTQDGGTRGQFATASAATRARSDVAVVQLNSHRIIAQRFRLANTLTATTTGERIDRRSTGPAVAVTDSALGAVFVTGAAAPAPSSRTSAAEFRSQASWFSATNVRRYVLQLQARYEGMTIDAVAPQTSFSVASPLDLARGRALSMVRHEAAPAASAATLVVAPAASLGVDLRGRGALLIGVRADAWQATDVLPSGILRGVVWQPRIGFQHQVGQRANGRGSWATLRGGAGRFADWPTPAGWSAAWSSTGSAFSSCTGNSVASIDVTQTAATCRDGADVVTPARLRADPSLRPVTSVRGELTLAITQLVRHVRADVGVAASRYDDVATVFSPYTGGIVRSRLSGEGDRATLVDLSAIGTNGIVPRAQLPLAAASPVLAASGRREGVQYRVTLATRDPWARTQLLANYAWNGGRQRAVLVAPADGAPGLLTAPATGNRHTIAASLGTWLGLAQVRASVIARSGLRFTPIADRDLNGDGVVNDAAFVPADRAESWATLVPSSLRGCVRRAADRLFAPNACEGPWSLGSNVFVQLPGPYVGLPRGMEVSLQLSNPTSLLAGAMASTGISFGTSAFVDPRLTGITSFDRTAQRFESQPLRGFGRPVGLARTVTDPAAVAISIRLPLGRSSFDRRIGTALELLSRDTSAAARARAAGTVVWQLPNVPEVFLTGIARSMRLTDAQRAAVDSLRVEWAAVTPRALAGLSPRSGADIVAREQLVAARARAVVEMMQIVQRLRSILTPGQIGQLEPYEAALLNLRVFRFSELSAYPL